jgi:hypothetical protein
MELEETKLVWKTDISLMGMEVSVEVFTRKNGKSFAVTRYSDVDIIITDGQNEEDAILQHCLVLPMAIDCRKRNYMTAGHEISN